MPELVANLRAERHEVRAGRLTLPLTVSDGTPTCYICCPSAAYIDYGLEELRHFKAMPALKATLGGVLAAARPLVRLSGLDKQAQPNNALFSTNILPDLSHADIVQVTRDLIRQWPDHAIVWRSLNDRIHGDLMQRFRAAGYFTLPSRQVYLFDARTEAPRLGRDERRDYALLDGGGDQVVGPGGMRSEDFERMAGLYNQLYRDKYSRLNPAYMPLFLRRAHDSGLLAFHGLRGEGGSLSGVIAFYRQGDTLTAPIVGYDTARPQSDGLYRRLMAFGLRQAREQKLLYHMSAGAAAFKRNRGALAALESMLIYNRHLPWPRRAAGRCIRSLLDTIGVPLLRRFEL